MTKLCLPIKCISRILLRSSKSLSIIALVYCFVKTYNFIIAVVSRLTSQVRLYHTPQYVVQYKKIPLEVQISCMFFHHYIL